MKRIKQEAVKRRPLGKHDDNRRVNNKRRSNNNKAALLSPDKSPFEKPPLPTNSTAKSRTLAELEKENTSLSRRIVDSSFKTPRISNQGKRLAVKSHRANDVSVDINEGTQAPRGKNLLRPTSPMPDKSRFKTKKHLKRKKAGGDLSIIVRAPGYGKGGSRKSASAIRLSKSGSKSRGKTLPLLSFGVETDTPTQDETTGSRENAAVSYLFRKRGKALPREDGVSKTKAINLESRQAYQRDRDLSPPSQKKQRMVDDDLDCDSDEVSLGIDSSGSACSSPSKVTREHSRVLEKSKSRTLRFPFREKSGSSLIDDVLRDDMDPRKRHSRTPFREEKRPSSNRIRGDVSNVVTKGMMRRARSAEVDNNEVMAAMLSSYPPNEQKSVVYQSPSFVGATVQVYSSPSADESELTARTNLEIEQGVTSKKKPKLSKEDRKRRRDSRHQATRQDRQASKNVTRETEKKRVAASIVQPRHDDGVTDAASSVAHDPFSTHPPMPPGWVIRVSKSKNKLYYVHPDFGSSWYPPVVFPNKPPRAQATLTDMEPNSVEEGRNRTSLSFEHQPSQTEDSAHHRQQSLAADSGATFDAEAHHLEEQPRHIEGNSESEQNEYDADVEMDDTLSFARVTSAAEDFPTNQETTHAVETEVVIALQRLGAQPDRGGVTELFGTDQSCASEPYVREQRGVDKSDDVEPAAYSEALFGDLGDIDDDFVRNGELPSHEEDCREGESPVNSVQVDLPIPSETERSVTTESEDLSDGGRNDTDSHDDLDRSFSQLRTMSIRTLNQQSRRRRSYGRISSDIRTVKSFKYRPSERITNPPHPLCSLQRLEEIMESITVAQSTRKRRSSKKKKRRTDSVRKHLVY